MIWIDFIYHLIIYINNLCNVSQTYIMLIKALTRESNDKIHDKVGGQSNTFNTVYTSLVSIINHNILYDMK